MQDKILVHINKILENKNNVQLNKLTNSMHLRDDIGLDSLDLAELTVRIESEFGIDIFENGIINTVGEIIKILENGAKK